MSVKVQGGANTGAAPSGFWGDDAVAVRTLRDGFVDAIKVDEYKPRDREGTSLESPLTFQGRARIEPGEGGPNGATPDAPLE
jgi:hypothetical protein